MATNPFDKGGATATKTRPSATKATAADDDDDAAPVDLKAAKDPFAMPGGGGGDYKFTEFLGELLAVKPTEVDIIPTEVSAETEVVRVDVVRLENENEHVEDLLVFQQALRRTLKKVLRGPNEWTLGRLEMGAKKPGKNAPYILTKPTEEEISHASTVLRNLGLL